MRSFLIFSILVFALQLSSASVANKPYDYIDGDEEYNEDDDDYTEGPLERTELDDEDSDVHVIAKKDELRQVIFNPRKRRERRRKHRG